MYTKSFKLFPITHHSPLLLTNHHLHHTLHPYYCYYLHYSCYFVELHKIVEFPFDIHPKKPNKKKFVFCSTFSILSLLLPLLPLLSLHLSIHTSFIDSRTAFSNISSLDFSCGSVGLLFTLSFLLLATGVDGDFC